MNMLDILSDEEQEKLRSELHKETDIRTRTRDNLFSANHRMEMLREHGYTEAEFVTVGQLV